MKFKMVSIFSIFSFASVFAVVIAMLVILFGYLGMIDKHGKVTFVANEIISNQTGIPLKEIEELEGIE